NHLLQLRAGDFALLRIWLFVNEPHLFHAIAWTEQQKTFARQTVASGASGFLIIAFNVFWQIVVNHETDVWFIDAHAESNGRTNHARFVAEKFFLITRTSIAFHSRLIRQRGDAVLGKFSRKVVGGFARLTINDATFIFARSDKR